LIFLVTAAAAAEMVVSVDCVSQVMEKKLERLGSEVNAHEGNLRFLKSEINAIEEACVDLASKLLMCSTPQSRFG
jgi:hypothetical protein